MFNGALKTRDLCEQDSGLKRPCLLKMLEHLAQQQVLLVAGTNFLLSLKLR